MLSRCHSDCFKAIDQPSFNLAMSSPSRPSGRVQVFARTRPTANFPLDVIQLESDKKVGPENYCSIRSVTLLLAVIDHVDGVVM